MDEFYRKENGICRQCTEKSFIDGLCIWHYQLEYGRRENVKARDRVKTEKKADGAVLPMRKSSTREVKMPILLAKSGRKQEAIRGKDDTGRKGKNVSKGISKAKARKRHGGRNKA